MFKTYRVKNGDSVESISKSFDIDPIKLLKINNMSGNELLSVDREIVVPSDNQDYFDYYVVKNGDSIYAISKKYNMNPDLLASLNGLNFSDYIYPDQVILIPKSGFSYYITKSGDTLDSVSNIFNISRDDLLNQNDVIYLLEGQFLVHKNSL